MVPLLACHCITMQGGGKANIPLSYGMVRGKKQGLENPERKAEEVFLWKVKLNSTTTVLLRKLLMTCLKLAHFSVCFHTGSIRTTILLLCLQLESLKVQLPR